MKNSEKISRKERHDEITTRERIRPKWEGGGWGSIRVHTAFLVGAIASGGIKGHRPHDRVVVVDHTTKEEADEAVVSY